MKKFILEVEHHYKNKFVGRYRFSSKNGTIVLGQSASSHIRLLGDDVSPIHTLVEYTGKEWYLIDAGSTSGTWLMKKPITSESFNDTTQVQIGGHNLTLVPKTIQNQSLFTDVNKDSESKGQLLFHQVVTVKSGMLMSTQLLPANEPYQFQVQGKDVELPAPKNKEWSEVTYGSVTVKQRLTRSDDISLTWGDRFKALAAPEMRTPLMMVFAFIFIIAGLIIAVPHAPEAEMVEIKKDNAFTRMIYDSKVLKQKREEAKERTTALKKAVQAGGGAGAGQEAQTTPIVSKGGTPKAVSKIKGLSAMLGKISARASSKSLQIVSQGRNPKDGAAGKVNLASVGSLQGIATQVGNGGEVFRVGGVGTVGKGGGVKGSLGALGALSGGNAGNASVGVLEEETEIEGGLDRDVIARIIQNQLGEIRYCYERQLSAEPDLYGKVQVKFTINETGTVLSQRVGITTLKNAMVEGCILRRMTRWKFPKPKGGTHVLVTYPFMFKSTN
jgi:hypothetical protein